MTKLLTTQEVANYLDCSTKHVSRLTRDQGLPCIRLGHLLRYRQEDLEEFLISSREGSSSPPPQESDAL